jgi:hypothetical protein
MTHYPILFGFRDLVAGSGFLASVATEGRALLVDEGQDDGFWTYGVNPGGIAGTGKTQGDAQTDFRQRYKSVLFDIAGASKDFATFKRSVEQFFNETNRPTEEEWTQAVEDVRAGRVEADWMPKGKAEAPRHVRVVEIQEPAAGANALDEQLAVAA